MSLITPAIALQQHASLLLKSNMNYISPLVGVYIEDPIGININDILNKTGSMREACYCNTDTRSCNLEFLDNGNMKHISASANAKWREYGEHLRERRRERRNKAIEIKRWK